jgi:hypothetical protein
MKHTITTEFTVTRMDQFHALGAAFEYIGQWAKAMPEMQDEPSECENLFMGAMNAGGFPSANPGEVTIRRITLQELTEQASAHGQETILAIDWPDGYSYFVHKIWKDGKFVYEVHEA